VVFILWGGSARRKRALVDTSRHVVLESAHPSPLSASGGFFGSRPFSRANEALVAAGRDPVDWAIPEVRTFEQPDESPATSVHRRVREMGDSRCKWCGGPPGPHQCHGGR